MGGFLDFMIGKIGNINKREGLEIYVFSEETKVGYLILNNFELSLEVHSDNLEILESIDNPIFNYNNSIFLSNSWKGESEFRIAIRFCETKSSKSFFAFGFRISICKVSISLI